jgi:tRNA A37 N6-isopentenylltransferase MiaA
MLGEADQITKLAKFPNLEKGKSDETPAEDSNGINEREGKEKAAMELRGQVRSQAPAEGGKLGNEGTAKVKRDICVATRQYAKRQLTWFAREPNLWPVIMTGNQSLPDAVDASGLPISL